MSARKQRPALFYKSVGGYTFCVQHRGRWHFVGGSLDAADHAETRRRMTVWYAANRERGFRRVGTFPLLERLYREHGATTATLKNNLPPYEGEEQP